jgi:hypothetical protein
MEGLSDIAGRARLRRKVYSEGEINLAADAAEVSNTFSILQPDQELGAILDQFLGPHGKDIELGTAAGEGPPSGVTHRGFGRSGHQPAPEHRVLRRWHR